MALDRARARIAEKKYRETHREVMRERARLYRANNPEHCAMIRREWQRANREKRLAQKRARYAANPEKAKAYARKLYVANAQSERARRREIYAENPARHVEYSRKWAKKNSDKTAATAAQRRAYKKGATPGWVDHDALAIVYAEAADRGLTVDHIIPLKHPRVCGLHVPWNLQLLTKSENTRKHNRFDESLALAA